MLVIAILVSHFFSTNAQAAGLQSVVVPANHGQPELSAMVWSPCAKAAALIVLGSFELSGQRDCAVQGEQLPLIVISHGDSGSSIGHHDTAAALADAGFVVAAVLHPGNNYADNSLQSELSIFESRPRDMSRLIDYMTQSWPNASQLNPARIGVFGFSRGGYTALALVGAKPDTSASLERFCATWWSFVISHCRQFDNPEMSLNPVADGRINAAVVVDPLNLFGAHSFQTVTVPVQLWASELGGDSVALSHIEAIKSLLPSPPEYHVAENAGHFVFLTPCPAALAEEAEEICVDPQGVNRSEFHQTFNLQVLKFFQRSL